uniref:Uncharacterized protein n=1 Tax=Arabidopsis thaliana TaxID=3702 RepID=Q0WRT6_ARATH|nr:hypothetical protein [Arabidopsis thaliana]
MGDRSRCLRLIGEEYEELGFTSCFDGPPRIIPILIS